MILKNRSDPLYLQLCHKLQTAIVNGYIMSGEKLDSERDIAAQYGVSRETVRRALKCLEEMRLVKILPQKGTYVL